MEKFSSFNSGLVLSVSRFDTFTFPLLSRAYDFAARIYDGHFRKSGDPCITHSLAVAQLLADMHFEPAVIAAGLLHEVLIKCEDKAATRAQLREQFGEEILLLVEGVTKLEDVEEQVKQDAERDRAAQELESLRKLFFVMAEDIRVIFIKLAARLHDMHTLAALPEPNQRRMARETLEIFAPLANRLGIWVWKADLEDLAFKCLYPKEHEMLERLLNMQREERDARVQEHIAILREALEKDGIPVKIAGRPKHIYSIYRKMHRKNVPIAKVYDAEGLRILVDVDIPLPPEADDPEIDPERLEQLLRERNQQEGTYCYRALGIVHALWTPVPGEFDDYIANPKSNGYQSLHTAVFGDDGLALEIQIRTVRMHEYAERGVAAHWRYKEKNVQVSERVLQQVARMRQSVQELTQDAADAHEFIETTRFDVFQDRVLVFSPKGKVVELPVGATVIDFAYHIHTEIGHHCRGAKVYTYGHTEHRWVPLDYQLRTGDLVQVVTSKTGGPSRDWLNEELGYIKTDRARQKIKQWFRMQSRDANIARGRTLIEQELKRLGLDLTIEEVADIFVKHYPRREDFYLAVGVGDVSGEHIVNRLEEVTRPPVELPLPVDAELQEAPHAPSVAAKVDIHGAGNLLTRVAGCCNPLPGEEVIGYVTRGRGVTIHKRDCPVVLRMESEDRERLIELTWGPEEQTFQVQVLITAYDRSRLLHDISGVMVNEDVNMVAVKTGKRDRWNVLPIFITVEVPNFSKLNRILAKVGQLANVIEARRIV